MRSERRKVFFLRNGKYIDSLVMDVLKTPVIEGDGVNRKKIYGHATQTNAGGKLIVHILSSGIVRENYWLFDFCKKFNLV